MVSVSAILWQLIISSHATILHMLFWLILCHSLPVLCVPLPPKGSKLFSGSVTNSQAPTLCGGKSHQMTSHISYKVLGITEDIRCGGSLIWKGHLPVSHPCAVSHADSGVGHCACIGRGAKGTLANGHKKKHEKPLSFGLAFSGYFWKSSILYGDPGWPACG